MLDQVADDILRGQVVDYLSILFEQLVNEAEVVLAFLPLLDQVLIKKVLQQLVSEKEGRELDVQGLEFLLVLVEHEAQLDQRLSELFTDVLAPALQEARLQQQVESLEVVQLLNQSVVMVEANDGQFEGLLYKVGDVVGRVRLDAGGVARLLLLVELGEADQEVVQRTRDDLLDSLRGAAQLSLREMLFNEEGDDLG